MRFIPFWLEHSVNSASFLNAIRFLANDLRILLVCVGTHEAKQALTTDQQLADRFEAWVYDLSTARHCNRRLLKPPTTVYG